MKKTFSSKLLFDTPSQVTVAELLAENAHDLRTRFEASMRSWGVLEEDQEIDWDVITPALWARILPLAFT